MPLSLTFATPEELKIEIELGKNADGQPQYAHEDAATLQLIYSEGARGETMEDSYEIFRRAMSQRWKIEVSSTMAYLIVEACCKATSDLKKKHINVLSSKSSESTPPA